MTIEATEIMQGSAYTVQQGDTLQSIALLAYGSSSAAYAQAICLANQITLTSTLTPGELLFIPVLASQPQIDALYIVEANDTLQSIALLAYGSSSATYIQDIYLMNQATIGSDPNVLSIGELLFIPPKQSNDKPEGLVAFGP